MAIKAVFNDKKTGKSIQKELSEEQSSALQGKKIGEEFNGELIDLTGYKFKLTGGSDNAGVPMRKDVDGTQRKKILAVKGVGLHIFNKIKKKGDRKIRHKFSGIKQRKLVSGNTVQPKTAQVNLLIVEKGKEDLFPKPEAEQPSEGETPKEEAKADEKKE